MVTSLNRLELDAVWSEFAKLWQGESDMKNVTTIATSGYVKFSGLGLIVQLIKQKGFFFCKFHLWSILGSLFGKSFWKSRTIACLKYLCWIFRYLSWFWVYIIVFYHSCWFVANLVFLLKFTPVCLNSWLWKTNDIFQVGGEPFAHF